MSANGFKLVGKNAGGIDFELRASWPAPFFVFVNDSETEPPLLIHCDDLAHAQRVAAIGGMLLNHDFTECKQL